MEKIIEIKKCKHCGAKYEITDKDLEFYDKISPTFNGEKFKIPAPGLCPECRRQRRLSFRNERSLYKRECSATGKQIVSIYSPNTDYKVYEQSYWWGDNWSALDYGRDFDFTKTFTEQFKNLLKDVPRPSVLNGFNENSYYCNHAGKQRNCYFSVDALENENCYYTNDINHSKNCLDSSSIKNSENIFNSTIIIKSFNCFDCINLENCNNCYLSRDLINCKNCLGCTNIANSEYFVLNRKVDKEEFKNIFNKYKDDYKFQKDFIKKYEDLNKKVPRKNLDNINTINSLGNYLLGVENVSYSYNIQNSKNLKYCTYVYDGNDCYDYDVWGEGVSLIYETHCAGGIGSGASKILFSNIIWGGSNIYYSDNLANNSHNCFGCVGLKNNESYCILNKQYSKEEYKKLVPKIIKHMQSSGEWGEFLDKKLSYYGYNETIAQDYYPLTKDEALEQGFLWNDYEVPSPNVEKVIDAGKLPNNISEIPDDIINWAIKCEISSKPFRILKQELDFYRKHDINIPKKHPDVRYKERFLKRNPMSLYDRKCGKCGVDIKTTYSPDREELIYCEDCYNKEVY